MTLDKPRLYATFPQVRWSEPVNEGSWSHTVIKKASAKNGSYSILGSVAFPDLDFLDETASTTDFYKVQYRVQSTGSLSFESEQVSQLTKLYMCIPVDVRRITGVTNEYTDIELLDFIKDADTEIFGEFGKPVAKIYTFFNSTGSEYYIGEGDVYRVDSVIVDNNTKELLINLGSYTENLDTGFLEFSGGEEVTYSGRRLEVEFVPSIYGKLSCYVASKEVLLSLEIVTGTTVTNTRIERIDDKIGKLKSIIYNREHIIYSTPYANWDFRIGKFVEQDFTNIY